MRHHRHGPPRTVLRAALVALAAQSLTIDRFAEARENPALGPSRRRYANAVAQVSTRLEPGDLLALLQKVERAFGRRAGGQRWAARVLDLDLVLWSGGAWAGPELIVPHPRFRERAFVLAPARKIAPRWRDPLTGLTLRHLHFRLSRHSTRSLTVRGPLPR